MVRFSFFVTILMVMALAAIAPAATITLNGAPTDYTLGSMSVDANGNVVINLLQVGTPGTPYLSLSPPTLPAGTVNAAYSQSVTMSVGNPVAGAVYTFGCSGTGIAGITAAPDTLNSAVCKISGTPTASGNFTVTFTATDGAAPLQQSISFSVSATPPPPPPPVNAIQLTRTTKLMEIPALGQQNFYIVMDKDIVSNIAVYLSTNDWATNQDVYLSDKGNIDCVSTKPAFNLPPNPAPWSTPTATNTEKVRVYMTTLGPLPAGTTWYATVCNRSTKIGKYFISYSGD